MSALVARAVANADEPRKRSWSAVSIPDSMALETEASRTPIGRRRRLSHAKPKRKPPQFHNYDGRYYMKNHLPITNVNPKKA